MHSLEPLDVVLGIDDVRVTHGVGEGGEVVGQLPAEVHLERDALPLLHLGRTVIHAASEAVVPGLGGVVTLVGAGGGVPVARVLLGGRGGGALEVGGGRVRGVVVEDHAGPAGAAVPVVAVLIHVVAGAF